MVFPNWDGHGFPESRNVANSRNYTECTLPYSQAEGFQTNKQHYQLLRKDRLVDLIPDSSAAIEARRKWSITPKVLEKNTSKPEFNFHPKKYCKLGSYYFFVCVKIKPQFLKNHEERKEMNLRRRSGLQRAFSSRWVVTLWVNVNPHCLQPTRSKSYSEGKKKQN